ncbi:hypothetical protein [Stackebrandtia albiflava]|uniref:hypothetical protein n=1 Tax=Stackebrandtia albiflava TaxID=406432 RepID=UPI0011BEDA75|nr:hypothetical protein [Stackebrandtia albiflava]
MALIAAARDAAGRVRDGVAGSVATGGEALDRLDAAGIGGSAAGAETMRAVELLGEALSEAEHLDGHLEKCRFIAMSAITGLYSNGTGGYQGNGESAGKSDAVSSGSAHIGDDVNAPGLPTHPFRQELAGSDEEDKSRLQRFGRRFVRAAGDLQKTGKDLSKSGTSQVASHDPHKYGQATVATDKGQPSISGPGSGDVQAVDIVSNAILLSAFAVEAVSRMIRKRNDGK